MQTKDIDATTVERICAKTRLQLRAPLEDAVQQLSYFRERYWRDLKLAPKISATELRRESETLLRAIKRVQAFAKSAPRDPFRAAVEAAGVDLHGTAEKATTAVGNLQVPMSRLEELIKHLGQQKRLYDRDNEPWRWPLLGKGKRALYPYVRSSKKDRNSRGAVERELARSYISDLYYFFFHAEFAAAPGKNGRNDGPGIRFACAVFEELALYDDSPLPSARLANLIGDAFNNARRASKKPKSRTTSRDHS